MLRRTSSPFDDYLKFYIFAFHNPTAAWSRERQTRHRNSGDQAATFYGGYIFFFLLILLEFLFDNDNFFVWKKKNQLAKHVRKGQAVSLAKYPCYFFIRNHCGCRCKFAVIVTLKKNINICTGMQAVETEAPNRKDKFIKKSTQKVHVVEDQINRKRTLQFFSARR